VNVDCVNKILFVGTAGLDVIFMFFLEIFVVFHKESLELDLFVSDAGLVFLFWGITSHSMAFFDEA
jgi:hypothetical protein